MGLYQEAMRAMKDLDFVRVNEIADALFYEHGFDKGAVYNFFNARGWTDEQLDRARKFAVDTKELEVLRKKVARLEQWTHIFGEALKPKGADTYGEGVRAMKAEVSRLLREP